MDWDRYKQLCDTPNVFSRWMLEQTIELLEADLAGMLAHALDDPPLPKPDGHRNEPATDMFTLRLPSEDVARICVCVDTAVAEGRTTSGTRGRGLGGFREAWGEYLAAVRVP